MSPKFRLFGGPNGSGKTFLFERLKESGIIHTELYINADRILRDLKKRGNFNFNAYHVKSSESDFKEYIFQSGLFNRFDGSKLLDQLHLESGVLTFDIDRKNLNAYHASFIASYLSLSYFKQINLFVLKLSCLMNPNWNYSALQSYINIKPICILSLQIIRH